MATLPQYIHQLDREEIHAIIASYQGYATECDIDQYIEPTYDRSGSILNGRYYDREEIHAIITSYQGYATECDIDQYIHQLDRERRHAA